MEISATARACSTWKSPWTRCGRIYELFLKGTFAINGGIKHRPFHRKKLDDHRLCHQLLCQTNMLRYHEINMLSYHEFNDVHKNQSDP